MQNRRGILFLILAAVLGIGAAVMAQRWLEAQSVPASADARPDTQPVAVVRNDASVGSILNPRELTTVDWPLEFVPQGAYSSPEQLEGRVLRRPLAGGEPVLETALLPVGSQGGLVSVIDSTRRAVSVKVDPVVGVAGFIRPGSQVDVIATLKKSDGKPYTKAILQDVKVLAIDQKLQEAREGDPQLVQVVTLEVSTVQAEKLTFAAHQGRLQLALRNPTDREILETRSVNANGVLGDSPRRTRPRPVSRAKVEVIKGTHRSVKSF